MYAWASVQSISLQFSFKTHLPSKFVIFRTMVLIRSFRNSSKQYLMSPSWDIAYVVGRGVILITLSDNILSWQWQWDKFPFVHWKVRGSARSSSSSLDFSSSGASWSGTHSLLAYTFDTSSSNASSLSLSSSSQCHDQRSDQEPHIKSVIWWLWCHRRKCGHCPKEALHSRAARKVVYMIETMSILFVRITIFP